MSKYFRTLRQVEKGRSSRRPATSATSEPAQSETDSPPVNRAPLPKAQSGTVLSSTAGSRKLLDAFLALPSASSQPRVVLAGAGADDATGAIVDELSAEAKRWDLKVLAGRPDGYGQEEIQSWLERAGEPYDLVVVQAPPLEVSNEAALAGKHLDGLVLVVEPLHTTRSALRSSVGTARRVDCSVLGLIVRGGHSWIPSWLRRFLPEQA